VIRGQGEEKRFASTNDSDTRVCIEDLKVPELGILKTFSKGAPRATGEMNFAVWKMGSERASGGRGSLPNHPRSQASGVSRLHRHAP
jgi:hypothetical protein